MQPSHLPDSATPTGANSGYVLGQLARADRE